MQTVINENMSDSTEIEDLFYELDKRIENVEANRIHTVAEAFLKVKAKLENEL